MRYLIFFLIALVLLGALLPEEPPVEIPAIDISAVESKLEAPQTGSALFIRDERWLAEIEIQDYLEGTKELAQEHDATLWSWSDSTNQLASVSAMGEDRQHHWVNSFLVGIMPFATENKWLPLYLLDQRKAYQSDNEQYGLLDVWQTSAQAFINLRGDCEDHAIVLADWLISLGIDARVVAGLWEGEGHAWVVAFRNNKTFLLEATDKRRNRAWSHYPLATLTSAYEPEFMFNRRTFWVNQGNPDTRDYQGQHGQATATFMPASEAD